jgi:hypothetical protein
MTTSRSCTSWNSGCTSIQQLHREITAQGYRDSYGTVYVYLRPFKALACAAPAVPAPPKVRHITSWILRDPATLDESEQASLDGVRARCPHLDALAGHVPEFAKILTGRRGEQLDAWIAKASAVDQPDLRSFITGLKRDYQAVLNGLTLPYSSGKVEGNVNRIILWNQNCQIGAAWAWRTSMIGRMVALAGGSSCRGVGPAGVGMSASRSSSRSRAGRRRRRRRRPARPR